MGTEVTLFCGPHTSVSGLCSLASSSFSSSIRSDISSTDATARPIARPAAAAVAHILPDPP